MNLSRYPAPDEEELRIALALDTMMPVKYGEAWPTFAGREWRVLCERLRHELPPGPWRLHVEEEEEDGGKPYPMLTLHVRVRVWGKRGRGGWRRPVPWGAAPCATCGAALQELAPPDEERANPHRTRLPCALCYRGGERYRLLVVKPLRGFTHWREGAQAPRMAPYETLEVERAGGLWWREPA